MTCASYSIILVRNSTLGPAVLSEIFVVSLGPSSGLHLILGHDHFLVHPFQFTIQNSTLRPAVLSEVFVVFLGPSSGLQLILGHDHFLVHPFQCIID